jgi:hypothetical protein
MSQLDQSAFNSEVTAAGITPGTIISDTSAGILVGTDAPTPKFTTSTTTTADTGKIAGKYTEEDLARVRQQEKDKLYPQLETLKEMVSRLEKEREEREAAEQAAIRAAEESVRLKTESETDLRTLLSQKDQEWQARIDAERAERESAFALLDREREYQALEEFRHNQIVAAQDDILPELLDLVKGNSQEEIATSINSLKERSARILESAQTAMQSARRDMVGSRVTAPSIGPMDTQTDHQQFTPDSIRAMSINEYAKNRSRLLGTNPSNRGMFG